MGFDHDAAGERGVSRQQFTDGLYTELLCAAEELDQDADKVLAEFHIGLFMYLMNGSAKPVLFPDPSHAIVTNRAMEEVMERTRSFTKDEAEYRYIILTLTQKLLASATAKTISDFATWESKTFRERGAF